jgi:adenosine deaminase
MGWYQLPIEKLEFYRKIPKVELHRHLEGSLRLETLREVARAHGLAVPTTARFRSLVQMQAGDPLTFSNFLSKFQTLRQFYRSPEVISRMAREAVEDASRDGVQYLELRFTPVALSRMQGYSLAEVMDWVIVSVAKASRETGLLTRLIASVNRNESLELAEEVINLAIQRMPDGIVGVDMAGNEALFPGMEFQALFRRAQSAGLHLTIHAGEWGPAENVRFAIEELNAERIGHGVRVMEDARVVELSRKRGTAFEVCMTSNYQSGVIPSLEQHPLPAMVSAGLLVTLNTDDPAISQITLSDEYRVAMEMFKVSRYKLAECILAGVRASFLADEEKKTLLDRMMSLLDEQLI